MDEGPNSNINSRFTMPLTKLGSKQYYLGIFFKVRKTHPIICYNFFVKISHHHEFSNTALSSNFSPIGTRLSNIVDFMGCIWLALTVSIFLREFWFHEIFEIFIITFNVYLLSYRCRRAKRSSRPYSSIW